MFLVIVFFTLVSFTYLYSISDELSSQIYTKINAIFPNPMTDAGYSGYETTRDFIMGALNRLFLPFILFLSLSNSFINRNQTLISYLTTSMAVVLLSPLAVYVFGELMTYMLEIDYLNPAYILDTYFDNFLYIIVANMLLSLASFVFVQKRVSA